MGPAARFALPSDAMKRPNNAIAARPPGDAEIRSALRTCLVASQPGDSFILDELGFCQGQVRVDLAVVNGILHGYEIKSDRDSLRRLERQAAIYSDVLDRVTLITGTRYVKSARRIVPTWWALTVAVSHHDCWLPVSATA